MLPQANKWKAERSKVMSKTYTAWELAADWWWDEDYECITENGFVRYECATVSKTEKTVRLTRLNHSSVWKSLWNPITRYVHPDTKMRLVPKL